MVSLVNYSKSYLDYWSIEAAFVFSFKRYLLSSYYASVHNTAATKKDTNPRPPGAYILGRGKEKKKEKLVKHMVY